MIIEALNKRPDLLSEAESYCKEKWNKVSAAFSQVASASISAQSLPQTWLILGEDERIRGFYQLAEHDGLAHRTELSPFLCTLFIDPRLRGGGFSEMLLTHAKYEAARLGYERLYIATDHIGYYERFGFTEIGSDITEWGSAAKIYSCDTPCGLRFEVFSKQHPRSDQLLLELARVRGWNLPDNPAASLRMMKHCGFPECWKDKWLCIVVFKDKDAVGAVNLMRHPDNALSWYLGDLYVAPEARRQGIATKLIQRGLEQIMLTASGGEFVYSYIERDNAPSISLHKALGFQDLGKTEPFAGLIPADGCTTWKLEL